MAQISLRVQTTCYWDGPYDFNVWRCRQALKISIFSTFLPTNKYVVSFKLLRFLKICRTLRKLSRKCIYCRQELEAKVLLAKDDRRSRSSCFTMYVLWKKESSSTEDNAEVCNSSLETLLTSGGGSGWRTASDISWISMDLSRTRSMFRLLRNMPWRLELYWLMKSSIGLGFLKNYYQIKVLNSRGYHSMSQGSRKFYWNDEDVLIENSKTKFRVLDRDRCGRHQLKDLLTDQVSAKVLSSRTCNSSE